MSIEIAIVLASVWLMVPAALLSKSVTAQGLFLTIIVACAVTAWLK